MSKVLIVEDDAFLTDAYQVKLKQEDVEVLTANDGAAGLELARSEHPDVIILDLLLPEIHGMTVLELIREDESISDTPVIVASNLDEESMRIQAENLGVQDFIIKSNITIHDLVAKVKKFL